MDITTLIAIAFPVGVAGGLAGHILGTRLFRTAGGYEDHEERLALVENLVRSVQRGQKAERMRQLRATAGSDAVGAGPVDGGSPFPWPTGEQPTANDPRSVKAALRAKLARGRV